MKNYNCTAVLIVFLVLGFSCRKSSTVSAATGAATAPSGIIVTTLASSGTNGAFNAGPHGIAADDKGNIFFSTDRGQILEINALGLVSTFAGGTNKGCEVGNGTSATFTSPFDICIDFNDNIYVADHNCGGIKVINSAGNDKVFAESDQANNVHLETPEAIGVNSIGNVYVGGEAGTDGIVVVTPQGKPAVYAGDGTAGYKDGAAGQAEFGIPTGICVNDNGDIYVADGYRIRVISQGQVSTLAGSGKAGYQDGTGSQALFGGGMGICLDSKGNLYVADFYNQCIREVTAAGNVTTVAGVPGVQGYLDGDGTVAKFSGPTHCCFDGQGNLIVADLGNGNGDFDLSGRIRKITFKK